MIEPLEQLLSPETFEGIGSRPLPELRELRDRCSAVESDISLVRRLAQGRLDIIGHEVRRRAVGSDQGGPDAALLFDLPDLMTDSPAPTGSPRGRAIPVGEPGEVAFALVERLDAIASPSVLGAIGDSTDEQIQELYEMIGGFELELSSVRRQLHERIDGIQAEIGRRYLEGEADIEGLLG